MSIFFYRNNINVEHISKMVTGIIQNLSQLQMPFFFSKILNVKVETGGESADAGLPTCLVYSRLGYD